MMIGCNGVCEARSLPNSLTNLSSGWKKKPTTFPRFSVFGVPGHLKYDAPSSQVKIIIRRLFFFSPLFMNAALFSVSDCIMQITKILLLHADLCDGMTLFW